MTDKPKSSTPPPKLTRTAIQDGLSRSHGKIVDAAHQVLDDTGLKGVTVHSILFNPPLGFEDQCDPPCQAGQRCVLQSSNGHVRPVCVDQSSDS